MGSHLGSGWLEQMVRIGFEWDKWPGREATGEKQEIAGLASQFHGFLSRHPKGGMAGHPGGMAGLSCYKEPPGDDVLWRGGTLTGWEAGARILSDPPRAAAAEKGQSSGPRFQWVMGDMTNSPCALEGWCFLWLDVRTN